MIGKREVALALVGLLLLIVVFFTQPAFRNHCFHSIGLSQPTEPSDQTCLIQVDPKTQYFIDCYGRYRFFHGVNVVYKEPPYIPLRTSFDPQTSLTDDELDQLRAWGFNVIRLGVMWPGWEPSEGKVNTTYQQEMLSLTQSMAKRGIYALLDFHQDLFNRKFCGEGFPDWFTQYPSSTKSPFPIPLLYNLRIENQTFYPNIDDCLKNPFFQYYFTEAVVASFQDVYDNVNGARDKFLGFWKQVSNYFSSYDFVLGYELINEPFGGNIYQHPTLLLPGVADRVNLAPLYSQLHQTIRQQDDKHLIFYEKAVSNFFPTGLTSGPSGNDTTYKNREVYSYHIYCGPTDRSGVPSNVVLCDIEDELFVFEDERDWKKLGGGSFLTEMGAINQTTGADDAIAFLLERAEAKFQSWAYWQMKSFKDLTTAGGYAESFYDGNGNLQKEKVKTLSRTYVQAVAGIPQSINFNRQTSEFQFQFLLDTQITQPTVVFANLKFYYPNGITIQTSPSLKWETTEDNYFTFSYNPSSPVPRFTNVFIRMTKS